MDDNKRWITWRGRRILVNNNGNIVQNKQDEKEKYFNEHFYMESYDKKNKDYGMNEKQISVYNKKDKKEVARLTYTEIYDKRKAYKLYDKNIFPNKINVRGIYVINDYQRKGIATQLYKELQRRAGNNDIYFGELSKEGKKLVESIGTITKEEKPHKLKYYWGRINK